MEVGSRNAAFDVLRRDKVGKERRLEGEKVRGGEDGNRNAEEGAI